MSGHDIPYQLRPNKFIDRQMFLEMLTRLIVPRGTEKYIYVSMGGRHLIDHYAVYNQLGIAAQLSFDLDGNEVARQKFNRPTGAMVCIKMDSADLPGQIDFIMQKFRGRQNLIVWLDYTTADRRTQLQQAIQTLIRLKHGDVFRITLNANPQTLDSGGQWKTKEAAGPGEYRAERLREQIGEFLPTEITSIGDTELPSVLAKCVELATKSAEALDPRLQFKPVLITSYRDQTRMLTATCVVAEADNPEVLPTTEFRRWTFACKGWDDIQSISAPVLSSKERYRLDANLHRGPKSMLSSLKFLPAQSEAASREALLSYRSFHRFYPTFRNVDD